ncbi:MAG: flavodoxin [Rhizobiales bacterium]|nr:flavodoxin [Hyphomicrobiales bacterium]
MANMPRRQMLTRALVLPLMAGVSVAGASSITHAGSRSKVLVAYFTRTGNTRLIATQIARALDATLFQIMPAQAYPVDYEAQVVQAESERERGYEPTLRETVPDLPSYETVFLGFPIWGMTAPAAIRAFLSQHNLSEKTLIPFITHGGYGLGRSLAVVEEHAPGARLIAGFSKECDQERETLRQVTDFLVSIDGLR